MDIEMRDNVFYTVRYMWREMDEKLCVKVVTGVRNEHEAFIENLQKEEKITNVGAEYVCEYDIAYTGRFFEIKKDLIKENQL